MACMWSPGLWGASGETGPNGIGFFFIRDYVEVLMEVRNGDIKPDIEPMLTTNEVAQLLDVHINTVRRWSNNGVLPAYRIGSRGDRRFQLVDILKLLG